MKADVCVIGGGPAGLMAAIRSAENSARTILVEANSSVGLKLLRTGRFRCNITHIGGINEFLRAYGPYRRFLSHSIHEFGPERLRQFFADRGLATKAQSDGCVFPATDRSTDVLRVLVDAADDAGVRFVQGRRIERIEYVQSGFKAYSHKDTFSCEAVVLACGGMTWPETGSRGDGYRLARTLGHEIVEPRGALVPLITNRRWPRRLAGVGVPEVLIKAHKNECKVRSAGPMIFTHDGIGGPAVFDISRLIVEWFDDASGVEIEIDLLPSLTAEQLNAHILELAREHPRKELLPLLALLLPRALAREICLMVDTEPAIPASQLPKAKRSAIVRTIKGLILMVKRTRRQDRATITHGGVSNREIDPATMQSNLRPGLFFAGEIIDADGPCGGFNLQIAFSTGHLAGSSAAGFVTSL